MLDKTGSLPVSFPVQIIYRIIVSYRINFNLHCTAMMRHQLPDHSDSSHCSGKGRIDDGEREILLFVRCCIAGLVDSAAIVCLWTAYAAAVVLQHWLRRNVQKLTGEVTQLSVVDTAAVVSLTTDRPHTFNTIRCVVCTGKLAGKPTV